MRKVQRNSTSGDFVYAKDLEVGDVIVMHIPVQVRVTKVEEVPNDARGQIRFEHEVVKVLTRASTTGRFAGFTPVTEENAR